MKIKTRVMMIPIWIIPVKIEQEEKKLDYTGKAGGSIYLGNIFEVL